MARTKTTEQDLPLGEVEHWKVVPIYVRQKPEEKKLGKPLEVRCYELRFGERCEMRGRGEAEASRFREMARFCNRRKLVPRAKIECAADAPNLDKYLRDTAAKMRCVAAGQPVTPEEP